MIVDSFLIDLAPFSQHGYAPGRPLLSGVHWATLANWVDLKKKKLLVTGSSGLLGSKMVVYFRALGWEIHGIDNKHAGGFFWF